MHQDECSCFPCITRSRFRHFKLEPAYPIEAYRLFVEMVTMMLLQRKMIQKQPPEQTVSSVITCKEILEKIPEYGKGWMGDLAPLVFELLRLRHSRDLHHLSEELIQIALIPGHSGSERFSDYDVDLIKAMREPSVQ